MRSNVVKSIASIFFVGERIEKSVSIEGKQVKLSVARVGGNLTPQVRKKVGRYISHYSDIRITIHPLHVAKTNG